MKEKNAPGGTQAEKLYSDHLLHAGYYAKQYACIIYFGKAPITSKLICKSGIALWKMLANILCLGYILIYSNKVNHTILYPLH